MIRQLYLPKNQVCLISEEDYEWASKFTWYLNKSADGKIYVCRYEDNKRIYIHREITDCPKGLVVDHANGNTLDNRRQNLRVCSQRNNMRNKQVASLTGFKGVTLQRGGQGRVYYKARITENGDCEEMHLGNYATAILAAEAYDRAALLFFGPFAWLNFPLERAEIVQADFEIPF